MKVEAFADPTPPALETDEPLADISADIDKLMEHMRDLSEQELIDQLYSRWRRFFASHAMIIGLSIRRGLEGLHSSRARLELSPAWRSGHGHIDAYSGTGTMIRRWHLRRRPHLGAPLLSVPAWSR